MAKVGGPKGR